MTRRSSGATIRRRGDERVPLGDERDTRDREQPKADPPQALLRRRVIARDQERDGRKKRGDRGHRHRQRERRGERMRPEEADRRRPEREHADGERTESGRGRGGRQCRGGNVQERRRRDATPEVMDPGVGDGERRERDEIGATERLAGRGKGDEREVEQDTDGQGEVGALVKYMARHARRQDAGRGHDEPGAL